jgi:hypothetical protein
MGHGIKRCKKSRRCKRSKGRMGGNLELWKAGNGRDGKWNPPPRVEN